MTKVYLPRVMGESSIWIITLFSQCFIILVLILVVQFKNFIKILNKFYLIRFIGLSGTNIIVKVFLPVVIGNYVTYNRVNWNFCLIVVNKSSCTHTRYYWNIFKDIYQYRTCKLWVNSIRILLKFTLYTNKIIFLSKVGYKHDQVNNRSFYRILDKTGVWQTSSMKYIILGFLFILNFFLSCVYP